MPRMVLVVGCFVFLVRDAAGQTLHWDPPPALTEAGASPEQESTAPPPPLSEKKTPKKVDKDKLRELARVSCQKWTFRFLRTSDPFKKTDKEKEVVAKKIAELKKKLRVNENDAESYLELSELYEDEEKVKEACAKAVELFERRIQSESENGRFHIQFAKALIGVRDFLEAENQLLEGIRISPQEWWIWQALGSFYAARAAASCQNLENKADSYGKVRQECFDELEPPKSCSQALASQLKPLAVAKKTSSILDMPTNPFQEKGNQDRIKGIVDETDKRSREPQVPKFKDVMEHVVEAQILEIRSDLEKAEKCFVKVVTLAPNDPDSYDTLAGFHSAKFRISAVLGADRKKTYKSFLTELRTDLKHLSDLCPDDPETHASYAGSIIVGDAVNSLESNSGPKKADGTREALTSIQRSLSKKSRAEIIRVMKNLKRLAHNKDQTVAETSCRALASLSLIMGDFEKAEASSRRALAIQPHNEETWDNLEMVLCLQERRDTQMQMCRDRLAQIPSAHAHLRLAKCHIDKKDFCSAETVLRQGLEKESNNIPSQISLAALLIRRSNQGDTLAEAELLLNQALKRIEEAEDQDANLKNHYQDAIFNKGIVAGLKGDLATSWMYFESMPDDDKPAKTARGLFSD